MNKVTKFTLQDELYSFPYHYLPALEGNTAIRIHQYLEWGLDYMTYMTFVADTVKAHEPASLCDVGCGDGRLIQLLKPTISDLAGIDLSERAVAFAQAFNPEVEIICGDIADLGRTFQWITLIEVLEHIPDDLMEPFLRNVARLLCPGGRVFITVPTTNVPLNPKHHRHYHIQELQKSISPYFEIEAHWWLYRRNLLEKVVRRMLSNRLFVLNSLKIRQIIWGFHRRYSYFADAGTGTHLACLARPGAG